MPTYPKNDRLMLTACCLINALACSWLAPPARGQSQGIFDLTSSRFGDTELKIDYASDFAFQESIGPGSDSYQATGYNFGLDVPVLADERSELKLLGRIEHRDIETRVRFPDTWEAFPDSLWDVQMGVSYRHKLTNDWIVGGRLLVGSPSDRPFASGDEVKVNFTGSLAIPAAHENDAWVFMLNYMNVRSFAPNVPLPGVGYQFDRGPTLRGIVGVPATVVTWEPIERLNLHARYFVLRQNPRSGGL